MCLAKHLFRSSIIALAVATGAPASASLIYGGQVDISGAGFGNRTTLLTLQELGPAPSRDGVESGCITPTNNSGGITASTACVAAADVFGSNGVTNVANDGADVSPPLAFPKNAAPLLGDLGLTDADRIGIIFNPVEAQNDDGLVTLTDLTLKFYEGTDLIFALDTNEAFNFNFDAGNGNAGFLFFIDDAQQNALDNALTGAGLILADLRLAAEATVSGAAGGPDSFFLYERDGGTPVPEPAALGLFGLGLLGIAAARRRRS